MKIDKSNFHDNDEATNCDEASYEEEAEITHHTSAAESSNDDDSYDHHNEAELLDHETIKNDKIIQSSSFGIDVATKI